MKGAIDEALSRILAHQTWILGPEVGIFEEQFNNFIGSSYSIGVSSGTEALILALRAIALEVKNEEYFSRDDEVITTSFSFTATGDTILRAGATPVFIDITPDNYNLNLDLVEEYLNSPSGNVRAIIAVHLYGQAVSGERLKSIGKKYNVKIIEDVAQACGASWNGTRCGAIGDIGAFSFFPSKNLGGFGDAGMVTTSSPVLAEYVRLLTKHGGKDKYDVQHIGYNARIDTIQAAILLAKLPFLEEFNTKRQAIASEYNKALSDIPAFSTPNTKGPGHVYHQYTMRIKDRRRDEFKEHLARHGIASMVYYPVPLHKMKVFAGRSKVPQACLHAELAATEVVSLPIEPLLRAEEISRVIEAVRAF